MNILLSVPFHAKELLNDVWISIDKSSFQTMQTAQPTLFEPQELQHAVSLTQNTIDYILLPTDSTKLAQISQTMHRLTRRCGGFFTHQTLQTAKDFLSSDHKALGDITYSIDNADAVNALMAQRSNSHLELILDQLSAYESRFFRADSGVVAAEWLQSHWRSLTENRTDIQVGFYTHDGWPQPSVMVTIEGSTLPDEYVVVGGHLDSINGIDPQSGSAPGVDDNASGIALISDLLKQIVASDYYPDRSLVLIGYAAEEVGLLGSNDIAQEFLADQKNVVGVTQFDMSAYFGSQNTDIVFIRDYTNDDQTLFMADLVETYLPDVTYGFDICGYACSDHASWNHAGYRASFPFEAYFLESNPLIHTSQDRSYDLTHIDKFSRLASAYVAELAKGAIGAPLIKDIVEFDASNHSINSGDSITLTINKSGPANEAVSLDYQTVNQSATAGRDYEAASGTFNWEAGDNSPQSITIQTVASSANKQFEIWLVGVTETAIISSNSIARITLIGSTPETEPSGNTGGGSMGLLLMLLAALSTLKIVRKLSRFSRHQ